MNSAAQATETESPQRASIFWPQRVLGPPPGAKEINLVCWALFVAFLVVPLCVVRWVQVKHGEGSVVQLSPDFVYFYGDGEIARQYSSVRIYDPALQQQVFNRLCPARNGIYGPSPYPPFVAFFFRQLTRVSFQSAYMLWMTISLAFYLAGIASITAAIFPGDRQKLSLILCFALAFNPFLFGTWINGQLAAVAVCATGLALHQEKRGNPFRAGLALALLTYKPTLLLLVLPMLLLTRRYRTLLGYTTGAGALVLATTAFAGIRIWPAYARMLLYFRSVAGVSGASRVQLWKHTDLNSFFAALPAGKSAAGSGILIFILAAVAIALAVLLWKSARANRPAQWLAWAATLTWTLMLNVYVPIYDSVLVVIAIILTLGALRDLRWRRALEWTTFLAVVIFAVSWVTESVAKAHGIQLFTVALFVLGSAQLFFLHRVLRKGLPSTSKSSTPPAKAGAVTR